MSLSSSSRTPERAPAVPPPPHFQSRFQSPSPFYSWLLAQRTRPDDVGRLAFIAAQDRKFPRPSHRLYKLLRWTGTNSPLRIAMRRAHREWRKSRRRSEAVR